MADVPFLGRRGKTATRVVIRLGVTQNGERDEGLQKKYSFPKNKR